MHMLSTIMKYTPRFLGSFGTHHTNVQSNLHITKRMIQNRETEVKQGFEGEKDFRYLMDWVCREVSIGTGSKNRVAEGSSKKRRSCRHPNLWVTNRALLTPPTAEGSQCLPHHLWPNLGSNDKAAFVWTALQHVCVW